MRIFGRAAPATRYALDDSGLTRVVPGPWVQHGDDAIARVPGDNSRYTPTQACFKTRLSLASGLQALL